MTFLFAQDASKAIQDVFKMAQDVSNSIRTHKRRFQQMLLKDILPCKEVAANNQGSTAGIVCIGEMLSNIRVGLQAQSALGTCSQTLGSDFRHIQCKGKAPQNCGWSSGTTLTRKQHYKKQRLFLGILTTRKLHLKSGLNLGHTEHKGVALKNQG